MMVVTAATLGTAASRRDFVAVGIGVGVGDMVILCFVVTGEW
jgi:hypothetical protein